MTELVVAQSRIPAMSAQAIQRVRALEAVLLGLPQVPIATEHVLHGGMYARTICIPAGVVLTGAFIRIPTLLVFDGHATVNTGEDAAELQGYHVLAASAHRRQAFIAHADTRLTMVFATQAQTVAEAEDEFTDEAHLLFSRQPGAVNHINITGE
ncbi:hypothetical protein [Acidovorax sp.]|uniref:hypothetical protein n=1 Tax=Acidovorax sp. TaxID=1872122 RepID=UPI0025C5F616|nr:hypothetical protein [Acidovorax sp.]MBW8461301.1 hypothetical protein [Acidovorax sp.]